MKHSAQKSSAKSCSASEAAVSNVMRRSVPAATACVKQSAAARAPYSAAMAWLGCTSAV